MMKLNNFVFLATKSIKKTKSEGIRVIIYPTEKYLESVKDGNKDEAVKKSYATRCR